MRLEISYFGLSKKRSLLPVSIKKLQEIAVYTLSQIGLTPSFVSIYFVSEARIRELNRQFLGHDYSTDVLTFPQTEDSDFLGEDSLGDIFLSPTYIRRQAKELGISFAEEFVRMFAHGILHAAGLDHGTEREAKKMFSLQEKIVFKFVSGKRDI